MSITLDIPLTILEKRISSLKITNENIHIEYIVNDNICNEQKRICCEDINNEPISYTEVVANHENDNNPEINELQQSLHGICDFIKEINRE